MADTRSSPPAQSPSPSACPCGSGKLFTECCGPLLSRERLAASAEELMRSRFTAHATRTYAHLHRSDAATAHLPYENDGHVDPITWTRLVIHAHEVGPRPDTATVDFSAYFTQEGKDHVLHEKSAFIRKAGEWLYTRPLREGPAPVKSTAPRVGRNDPCPCGSGKKYKHCCLAA